jgi:hypothetical protein
LFLDRWQTKGCGRGHATSAREPCRAGRTGADDWPIASGSNRQPVRDGVGHAVGDFASVWQPESRSSLGRFGPELDGGCQKRIAGERGRGVILATRDSNRTVACLAEAGSQVIVRPSVPPKGVRDLTVEWTRRGPRPKYFLSPLSPGSRSAWVSVRYSCVAFLLYGGKENGR